ncbi:hypothetical protein, partial [Psychromonas ossibalaenae]|uniref:hypothetical protein n=1 Tax=Psychromonas ossibalaenae TaxID=444922 RepID=UPI0005264254
IYSIITTVYLSSFQYTKDDGYGFSGRSPACSTAYYTTKCRISDGKTTAVYLFKYEVRLLDLNNISRRYNYKSKTNHGKKRQIGVITAERRQKHYTVYKNIYFLKKRK